MIRWALTGSVGHYFYKVLASQLTLRASATVGDLASDLICLINEQLQWSLARSPMRLALTRARPKRLLPSSLLSKSLAQIDRLLRTPLY